VVGAYLKGKKPRTSKVKYTLHVLSGLELELSALWGKTGILFFLGNLPLSMGS